MEKSKQDNVKQTDWGYEIEWAKHDTYCGKILVFTKKGSKTDIFFNKEIDKTWFVNSGEFKIRWIDTASGQLYEQECKEGSVFECASLKPASLECLSDQGSLTEVSNGYKLNDTMIVFSKNNF